MVRKLRQKRVMSALVGGVVLTIALALMWSSCGKKSDDDPAPAPAPTATDTETSTDTGVSNDVTLSGTLNLTGTYLHGYQLTTFNLYCITFEDPPASAKGDADTDGNFSLTLAGAKDKPFGCFVRQGNTTIATLTFEDTASNGLDGSTLKSGSISLSGSADFGTITVDLDKGIATVDIADIKKDFSEFSEGEQFDPEGAWIVEAMPDSQLPDGYIGACASGGQDCSGPAVGQSLYMKRLTGHSFTPDATCQTKADANDFNEDVDTCNGTAASDEIYGLMVWASEEAFNTCGGKVGFTEQGARANAHISFEGTNVPIGKFTWSTSVAVDSTTYAIEEGWRATDQATSTYQISDCTLVNGVWQCGDIIASAGSLCKNITDSLWKNRCYANFYTQKLENPSRSEANCLLKKNFKWDATTADDFIWGNRGMQNPGTLYLLNGMSYSGPSAVAIKDQNVRTDGFQMTDTNSGNKVWKQCQIAQDDTITITQISSTEAIIDMQMVTKLATSDSQCSTGMANRLGETRMMAKLIRQ